MTRYHYLRPPRRHYPHPSHLSDRPLCPTPFGRRSTGPGRSHTPDGRGSGGGTRTFFLLGEHKPVGLGRTTTSDPPPPTLPPRDLQLPRGPGPFWSPKKVYPFLIPGSMTRTPLLPLGPLSLPSSSRGSLKYLTFSETPPSVRGPLCTGRPSRACTRRTRTTPLSLR